MSLVVKTMVPIKEHLAHKGNYGDKRSLSTIKYIVIHYTANDGDTDENNGKYFANNDVDSSAHYFVDDDSITRSVPDEYVAWHCGAKTYKHKTCRNANSIGIEICDDVKNGKIYPSDKTIQNVLDLTRSLMKKYNIPAENVIRHYDVTGKLCPAYWVNTGAWQKAFWNHLKDNTLAEEKANTGVSVAFYKVKATNAEVYSEPATTRINGVFTIIEEKNGFGKLKSGAGWIKLSEVKKV